MIADPQRTLSRSRRLISAGCSGFTGLSGCIGALILAACTSSPSNAGPTFQHLPAWAEAQPVLEAHADSPERKAVEVTLDGFHRAASEADGRAYFGLMAEGSVFLGTDATERWEKAEFRAYADPFFAQGRGWTYHALERHIYVSDRADVAWFDERLTNDKYGDCRGTGVLVKHAGTWRVAQYNLTFPVPNGIASEVVTRIREHNLDLAK